MTIPAEAVTRERSVLPAWGSPPGALVVATGRLDPEQEGPREQAAGSSFQVPVRPSQPGGVQVLSDHSFPLTLQKGAPLH